MEVLVHSRLATSKERSFLAARRANGILGCIGNNTASKLKKVILPLYSFLMRVHLHYCVQFSAPQCK